MKSPFWNKTLTVYTKYFDEETKTATWYRYVLTDCFFARTNKARFASPELYRESENLARIPAQENYVPYAEWCAMSDEERTASFSEAPEKSIVFLGEIGEDITDGRGTALRKKYPESFAVGEFRDNTAFALSHYYAEGT